MLKDIVLDVSKNIASLGTFEEILVEKETDKTKFTAYPEDSTLTVLANTSQTFTDLPEKFGMLNLGFLVGLSGLYKDQDANVNSGTNSKSEVDRFVFSDKNGNNDHYRLTPTNLMKTKTRNFKGTSWDVTVQPASNKISELAVRAGLYTNIDPNLTATTENGKLVFTLGGAAGGGHSGKFVFADTTQTLKRPVVLPIQPLILALKTASQGTPTVSLSEKVARVEFDSGVIAYEYLIMAQG
jgi:hypothetical protein